LSTIAIQKAEASPVDGTWIIRNLAVNIYDCDLSVCGKIVWIKDTARRASQCGKTIHLGTRAEGTD
jgi:uncharacterized protein (DUF2147 family)